MNSLHYILVYTEYDINLVSNFAPFSMIAAITKYNDQVIPIYFKLSFSVFVKFP